VQAVKCEQRSIQGTLLRHFCYLRDKLHGRAAASVNAPHHRKYPSEESNGDKLLVLVMWTNRRGTVRIRTNLFWRNFMKQTSCGFVFSTWVKARTRCQEASGWERNELGLGGNQRFIVAARMRDIQDLWRDYPASDIGHIVVCDPLSQAYLIVSFRSFPTSTISNASYRFSCLPKATRQGEYPDGLQGLMDQQRTIWQKKALL
jgi:hypothetical protein